MSKRLFVQTVPKNGWADFDKIFTDVIRSALLIYKKKK